MEVKFGIPQLPKYDFVEDVGLEGPTCIKYSFLNMHKAGLKEILPTSPALEDDFGGL